MTLKINRLIINIDTTEGMYGTDLSFELGLNILRAENSSGKSTSISAIMYALGLEGMLTAKHIAPLPYAMQDKLKNNEEVYIKVLKSSIYLEIENERNEIITLNRDFKGGKDIHIITVYEGKYNEDISSEVSKDYFVRQSGSASRERGFHKKLADFLNWNLPEVTKYNGTLSPLYIECIFPLMIVEQKRGWSAIQSNTPKQYSIKEVEKRALEFLLNLDSYSLALKREKLLLKLKDLKDNWKAQVKNIDGLSRRINGKVINLPVSLDEKTELAKTKMMVIRDDELVDLSSALKNEIYKLKKLNEIDVKTVKDNKGQLLADLNIYEEKYYNLEEDAQQSLNAYELEKKYYKTVESRISATSEDLRKYKDIQKIRKMGSLDEMEFASGVCPTCHQEVENSLLLQNENNTPMSIEENINFLDEQKKTYQFIANNSQIKLKDFQLRLETIRYDIEEIRGKIRSIKFNLLSPDNFLNQDVIRDKVVLEEKVKFEQEIIKEYELLMGSLENIQEEFKVENTLLNDIPSNLLSEQDLEKLKLLERKFKKRVSNYGLSSVDTDSLYISKDTYKPLLDGFDIESNLSASDLIRTIWAYLISILELEETNHLKLLILDEPKQHSTNRISFNNLLKDYSKIRDGQIIFATSESEKDIKPILDELECNYLNVTGLRIFKKL